MKNEQVKCSTCCWWNPRSEGMQRKGECRVSRPMRLSDSRTGWPSALAYDWCGDWMEKEPHRMTPREEILERWLQNIWAECYSKNSAENHVFNIKQILNQVGIPAEKKDRSASEEGP
jgi:hypothetical protein